MQGFDVYTDCGNQYTRTAVLPFEDYNKMSFALQLVDCPWDKTLKAHKAINTFTMQHGNVAVCVNQGAILMIR